jgi:hypothetical protein
MKKLDTTTARYNIQKSNITRIFKDMLKRMKSDEKYRDTFSYSQISESTFGVDELQFGLHGKNYLIIPYYNLVNNFTTLKTFVIEKKEDEIGKSKLVQIQGVDFDIDKDGNYSKTTENNVTDEYFVGLLEGLYPNL